jgi:hypothetical protein
MARVTAPQNVTLKQAIEQRPWLTERWLRRAVQERRLPFFKVDGKLVFNLADLDGYVETNRVTPM